MSVLWLVQIQIRSLIGGLPNWHQFENDKRYRTGIWDCYLHTILVNTILVDWVQYVRDLGTLLSMKILEKSLVMVSRTVPDRSLGRSDSSVDLFDRPRWLMNREFLENGFKKLDFIGNIDQFKEFIKTDSSMLEDSFWSDQLTDNKILDCLPEFRLGGAKCKVCAFNTTRSATIPGSVPRFPNFESA